MSPPFTHNLDNTGNHFGIFLLESSAPAALQLHQSLLDEFNTLFRMTFNFFFPPRCCWNGAGGTTTTACVLWSEINFKKTTRLIFGFCVFAQHFKENILKSKKEKNTKSQ
jgi:hypothetical protein